MYGIIYYKGVGKYSFFCRQFVKFRDPEEERLIAPFIKTIIEEETGDGILLMEKMAQYVRENHLELEFPIDLIGIEKSANLSDRDRIEMLETSVRALAQQLEDAQRKAWELEYARWYANNNLVSVEFILSQNAEILEIAISKFGDENISDALLKATEAYKQDIQDHLQ